MNKLLEFLRIFDPSAAAFLANHGRKLVIGTTTLFVVALLVSSIKTWRDVEAAHYTPPPAPKVDLNRMLIERELAKHRRPPPAPNPPTMAKSKVEMIATPKVEPVSTVDTDLPAAAEADDEDDEQPSPKVDAFGRSYDAPDPCEGHRESPDFSSGDWPSLCVAQGIPHEACAEKLKLEWSICNGDFHPDFTCPPGCLP